MFRSLRHYHWDRQKILEYERKQQLNQRKEETEKADPMIEYLTTILKTMDKVRRVQVDIRLTLC